MNRGSISGVSAISRPVGGYMLTKPPVPLDMMRVLKAAAEADTVIEVDANPACTDDNHIVIGHWLPCSRVRSFICVAVSYQAVDARPHCTLCPETW